MSGGALAGLSDRAAVAAFFADFPTIVLVANSEAVDVATLQRTYGEGALYVFFNKVYKVLDVPFAGHSVLVARSSPAGANIVYRREVASVTKLLDGSSFAGILNVRAGAKERLSEASEFGRADIAHLDLVPDAVGFYPKTHVPTSGFALALFLRDACPRSQVVLAGFTAKRSTKWRLFDDHDWTFEQIVLRLLLRTGRLTVAPGSPGTGDGPLAAIATRFPDIDPTQIALAAADVLSERLETANTAIDGLLKVTRPQARVTDLFRSLKPKTRKQRLADQRGD